MDNIVTTLNGKTLSSVKTPKPNSRRHSRTLRFSRWVIRRKNRVFCITYRKHPEYLTLDGDDYIMTLDSLSGEVFTIHQG